MKIKQTSTKQATSQLCESLWARPSSVQYLLDYDNDPFKRHVPYRGPEWTNEYLVIPLLAREREMFYLTMHLTHFIYGYMPSDIWLRTILIVRKETCCRHIGHSYRLTARVLLYAPSNRQDNTYHSLCYTRRGALVGTRNSSMGPPPLLAVNQKVYTSRVTSKSP